MTMARRTVALCGLAAVLRFDAVMPAFGQIGHMDSSDETDIQDEALSAEQLRALHGRFDLNGDGKVSIHEVMRFSDEMTKAIAAKDIIAILEDIDGSKDGKLSLEEHLNDIHNQVDGGDQEELQMLEQRKDVETKKFAIADANGDNVLDERELPHLFYPETHPGVLEVTVADALKWKDINQDGLLSPHEFWESNDADGMEEAQMSEEELQDFNKLDTDRSGFIDLQELMVWESGRFHTEAAMSKLLEIADKDHDMHLSADELAKARDEIAESDAQYHLIEWAEHAEL